MTGLGPRLVQDDFDAAVLRLAHAGAGRDQEVGFAVGVDGDFRGWDAVGHQLGGNRFGAAFGEALVVGGGAGSIRVAGNIECRDSRGFAVGRRLGDDLGRARGERVFIPVEEDQVGFR